MKTLLVTGGAGFIGSNFILQALLRHNDYRVVNFDLLTYAGNLKNLKALGNHKGYGFVRGSITKPNDIQAAIQACGSPDVIINFAAESHVDRSIDDAAPFIETNIKGTYELLEAASKLENCRFVQVSTDEVYGALGADGLFTEETPPAPNSPYSASKAAADFMVRAFVMTHGLDAVVTRCSNNYGPYQFPEKLIPLMITNIFEGKKLPVYGDGLQVRDWIHVTDHCEGLLLALEKGRTGEVYNFGGGCERTNLSIVEKLCELEGVKSSEMIEHVEDRPGHDRRYAVDFSKAESELGFKPKRKIDDELEGLIKWYRENEEWWTEIKSGEYMNYYNKFYSNRPLYG